MCICIYMHAMICISWRQHLRVGGQFHGRVKWMACPTTHFSLARESCSGSWATLWPAMASKTVGRLFWLGQPRGQPWLATWLAH